MTEIADAEVVSEDGTEVALVHTPRRGEVLKPLALAAVKEAMADYQQGMRELLVADDWQGKPDAKGSFVKKSGWRKIATWFDLSIELLRDQVERGENGEVSRATVWARAVAPSGRFADGDGYCDVSEKRFNSDDAKKRDASRAKLENDLRGTATTRAMNRAISNLVGMGAVSAEEMTADAPDVLPLGPRYDKELVGKATGAACVKLAGNDKQKGIALFKVITADCGGYFPQAAALALINAASVENLVPDVEAPDPS